MLSPRFIAFLLPLLFASCNAPGSKHQAVSPSEVLVLGMIHGDHLEREDYSIEVIQELARSFKPDYILCEIPPDRIDAALASFTKTGQVQEERVLRFPEYTQALIPLQAELGFEFIACAAWTKEMADARNAKLSQWQSTRSDDSLAVQAGMEWIDAELERQGLELSPAGIHDPRYDAIVREGMQPYSRLFNDDLGPGGWENINAAHYALIDAALDQHAGEGARFLVTFGAWHKYWIIEALNNREDVRLLELSNFR